MKLDTQTLAFMLSLAFFIQFIALFVQYKIGNRTYNGIGWWLLGSSLMALGVIFMPMINVKSLEILARIANPLMVLGQIFLYIGIIRFFDKKENLWMLSSIYIIFSLFYYYYMYFSNSISSRSIVINVALAAISFLSARKLFSEKDSLIATSANFIATVFLIYGVFLTTRFFWTISIPPAQTYLEHASILNAGFIVSTVASTLWTFGFILMNNQRLNIENRLEKEKMQLVFNTSPDAALITRLSDGLFVDVNVGFTVLSGYTRDEVLGSSTININVWHNTEDRKLFLAELNDQGICENKEFIFHRKDGNQFFGMISARIILIQSIPHIVSVVRDITERKQAEEALMESEEQYRSILNASPDNITITDLDGRILMISPAAKKMFGYEPNFDKFIGMRLLDFIVPEDIERAQSNLLLMYQGDPRRPNEYRGVRKDKSIFNIEVNSGFVRNANGQPIKMVFIIRDITERKLAEQHIQELVQQLEIEKNTAQLNSITDSLTGLVNRRFFDMALNTEFYRLKRFGATLSLIMLDVDHFKKFNDSYGHLAGDDCLIRIGTTLKTIVGRATDIVARFGGEEFAVILPVTERLGAETLAERIRKGVEDLSIPHSASDTAEYVTVSLGVVSVNTISLFSPKQVVAMADEALYSSKKQGRNRITFANDKTTFVNSL
ncbi:sensor domain-containing diguanylate cyclase [Alkalibacter saccharofermentans]|uniref:PAS domain S-box-containing protein/diguanylate cyclase (GGDEF) domain-containing protein n=1 Tax=Alkalibacter saccharofermentans DSM 14828 TaxID=1120975 RepID=A0A1M4SQ14_9FIRM|nr:diguanylate cyclase [Alkalibacter saccharofermentans]SHE34354.1 PAS domain S-box-containing protein/diguanylate cyclase (GGDEF) domain-containing protein [Alkalibacter saccharofermentans DSM 14828]